MRLNNRNKQGIYNFIGTVCLLAVVIGIVVFLLERYRFDVLGPESFLFLLIPLVLLSLFYVRGRQIFEYDSDGEALNFKNRNVIIFFNKPISDEFPKYKLLDYEIVNAVIFRRLYITISSKKNYPIILKYDVSYLSKKQLNDLKFSLTKVVVANKEIKRENNS